MLTIAQKHGSEHPELDHELTSIGPVDGAGGALVSSVASLLARLAVEPVPSDPDEVEALRDIARTVIALLPADHPLAGADLTAVGAPLLERLLVRVAPDLGPDVHPGAGDSLGTA